MVVLPRQVVATAALAAALGLRPGPILAHDDLAAQEPETMGHPVDWRGDLDYLVAVLPRVHGNLYHTVSPERFDSAASELAARIESLPAAVARVELAGLVAMIGDGHTRVNLLRPGDPGVPAQPDSGFVPLPVELYLFADGIYVRAAAEEYRDLVGDRVTRIGTLSAREAADRVGPFMHRDNDMTVRLGTPWLLVRPAFLRAAGVTDNLGSIPMEFETRQGQRVRRQLRPAPDANPDAVDARKLARIIYHMLSTREPWCAALTSSETARDELQQSAVAQTTCSQAD